MTNAALIVTAAILLAGSFTGNLAARSGCCSYHQGVAHCHEATGYWLCRDGTDSPSCRCKDGQDVRAPVSKKHHMRMARQ